ncbi:hypothetical protein [Frigidibacter sp. ROC022]|uniref:hypothetical protein n=1 Tax=Frigidibacter sp. ROC022 TaxID=2971796 RepID=UPI00215AC617|nr:hypothetical protein [Frigidibacter sp. ROC022]MCR8723700.1 hypothetical protein [Frigidibacter sp. ROC022]
MGLLEEKGEDLAKRAIEAEKRFGDPTIPDEIGKAIGATSTTLQEAYLTALRILRAADRADDLLGRIIAGREKGEVVVSTESVLEDDPNLAN